VKTKALPLLVGLLLSAYHPGLPRAILAEDKTRWWSDAVEQALIRSGNYGAELVKALKAVPADQRKGMAFLVANMPDADLKSLKADFLLENVALAYKARKEVPWGRLLPEEIYLNQVLPYANVDEARHPWRKSMYELCLPLVKDCKTAAEAAHRLNSTIFKKLKVRYSTERSKPHQSPKESIESGKASCTGLSILLIDACRSVGVPARLVGTPLWANRRGNHTWVEIWDGDWHFAGAAEPDAKGLDHAWFVGEAAKAKKDSLVHAIYAVSFRKTAVPFPLVWAPDRKDVYAENVTERYARKEPAEKSGLSREQVAQVEKEARAFFAASPKEQAQWKFDEALDRLLAGHEEAVRRAVWKAYQAAPIHTDLKKDFDKNQVRYQKHMSPYTVKSIGQRPASGWPLFIAMHGGGGVPKRINDSQWQHMQIHYLDQKSLPGYKYLALRAPNDTWNGFYDDYVPPLVSNLIHQFLLFGDVDPNKVFLMGYSHGGYGAFFIGPKIPDRFAAVHSSAAAPTDGAISPRTLRNTRFTFMVGANDNAYGRRQRCEKFSEAIQKLKQESKDDYPVVFELKKGFGHGGLPDRDKIKEMYPFTRNPVPRHSTWDLTDAVITHFFWLSVPEPAKGKSLDAAIKNNTVQITTGQVKQFDLLLDNRLVAFDKPLRVTVDGNTQVLQLRPRIATLCQSLLERGDPELAFACRVTLQAQKGKGQR
jgi:transglutaminase-like putative cysteine protease/predicted esterase